VSPPGNLCLIHHLNRTVSIAAERQHQRARATESRANGTISVRALRCMR
jgi:hypothetical protein